MKARLPAEKRIELVHVSLMRSKEFALFAGLFMVGKAEVRDVPMTAGTNGRDVFYGRAFVDSLSDRELAFLVMHENMHKAYRHLTTWRNLYEYDRDLANAACDYVINIQLCDLDPEGKLITMPTDKKTGKVLGLIDYQYRGMDTRQVFDLLRKKCQKPKRRGGGGQGGNDRQDVDDSDDGQQGGQGDQPSQGNNGFDHHDWEGAQDGMSDKERQQLERDIDQALRQGGIYAGKVGANIPREIGELLAPKVDWREVLRRFVRTNLRDRDSPSWRRAHKNYLWQDVILPSILGKRMKSLVVAIDTSGSIVGPILDMFLSEMDKIIKDTNPERIDVIYWDTQVQGHETFTGSLKDVVSRTKPVGGGGTVVDCVPEFMQKHQLKPDALVVLTDGYVNSDTKNWQRHTTPTMWCVIGNNDFHPPVGQVVNVEK